MRHTVQMATHRTARARARRADHRARSSTKPGVNWPRKGRRRCPCDRSRVSWAWCRRRSTATSTAVMTCWHAPDRRGLRLARRRPRNAAVADSTGQPDGERWVDAVLAIRAWALSAPARVHAPLRHTRSRVRRSGRHGGTGNAGLTCRCSRSSTTPPRQAGCGRHALSPTSTTRCRSELTQLANIVDLPIESPRRCRRAGGVDTDRSGCSGSSSATRRGASWSRTSRCSPPLPAWAQPRSVSGWREPDLGLTSGVEQRQAQVGLGADVEWRSARR